MFFGFSESVVYQLFGLNVMLTNMEGLTCCVTLSNTKKQTISRKNQSVR